MSQQPDTDFDIDPYTTSGIQLVDYINNLNNALLSMRSGTSRPPSAQAGTVWLDTTSATDHISYFYDGSVDIKIFTLKVATNSIIFEDTYISFKGTSMALSEDGSALANDDSTDNNNIAIGNDAGAIITSGFENILLGEETGASLITGRSNTVIGQSSGPLITGDYNVYLGRASGNKATSGTHNTGLGNRALAGSTDFSGTNNIGIGNDSASRLSTGSYNIAIGDFAGTYTNAGGSTLLYTFTNTICIGTDAYATASGEMSLGHESYITTAFSAVAILARSDERHKNIQDIDLGLDFINAINPIKFTWKTGADKESINYGFSAQQVKATLEDQVGNEKRYIHYDRAGVQHLAYTEFVAPLVKAVQELSTENQQLKNDYNSLLKRVIALESKIG